MLCSGYLGRGEVTSVRSDQADQVLLQCGVGEVGRVAVRVARRSQSSLACVARSRTLVATASARRCQCTTTAHPRRTASRQLI